jgi:hypothetical protein
VLRNQLGITDPDELAAAAGAAALRGDPAPPQAMLDELADPPHPDTP